ncbi:MAG: hypothetical protein HPY74_01085 [Firmicutes bacterium]|nr:hypothetical protein [Bacillota bacterium]
MGKAKIISPYLKDGLWVKANFHVHPAPISNKTGYCDSTIIREYIKAEYSCISLVGNNEIYTLDANSEDNGMLISEAKGTLNSSEMLNEIIIIPGFESTGVIPAVVINSLSFDNGEIKNEDDLQTLIYEQIKNGGIVFFSQPMRYYDMEERFKLLLNLDGYLGIEVLNGNLAFGSFKGIGGNNANYNDANYNKGNEIELWDRLLSSGKKVWGFGNDGLEKWSEFNTVFNLVKLQKGSSVNAGRIIGALIVGSFAVSTGVRIKDISVEENEIKLAVYNSHENKMYIAYGEYGRILKTCYTKEDIFVYEPEGDEGYVRMQVIYESGKTLLTQPFFIE